MDLGTAQIIILGCSVECFLLAMLLESRNKILAMLFSALAFILFLCTLGWSLIENQTIINLLNGPLKVKIAIVLVAALWLTTYLVRNFMPRGPEPL
jgi:hypothetical protein